MLKKIIALVLIVMCISVLSVTAFAEGDYSYLDDMTINQLKELDAEIHKRLPGLTNMDSNMSLSYSEAPSVEDMNKEYASLIREEDDYILMFDNKYMTVYCKRFEDKTMLNNSIPPFYQVGFKLHIINKTKDKYLSLGVSNMTIGSRTLKAYFMGCDYAAPNTDIYTKLFFTRKVGEDEECAFVSSYEDLVDLKGTLWIYYNTSGGRSGHGLEQVKVELY